MKQDDEQLKRMKEDDRVAAEEAAFREGKDATHIILMPEYTEDHRLKIDREVNKPSEKLYLGLGWDEDGTTKRRHYRKFYADELENITEVMPKPSPFNSYNIKRG